LIQKKSLITEYTCLQYTEILWVK